MSVIDRLLRLTGWRLLALNSDPLVTDRALFLAPWLLGPQSAPRTLDAGCGNGSFAFQAAAASRGPVLAVSDDPAAIEKAAARAAVLGADAVQFRHVDLRCDDALAALGRFDQILLLETIEHVADDAQLIERLARHLTPAGRLLITTPSHDHAPLFGEGRHLSGGVEDGRHVRWGYSPAQLRRLVEGAGLQLTYLAPVGGMLMRAVTSLLWRLSEPIGRPAALLVTAPLRLLRPVDPLLTRLTRSPSHCWGVVATWPPQPAPQPAAQPGPQAAQPGPQAAQPGPPRPRERS